MIKSNHDKYKNTTKEERVKQCNNIICPRCNYHNHEVYIKNMVNVICVVLF